MGRQELILQKWLYLIKGINILKIGFGCKSQFNITESLYCI